MSVLLIEDDLPLADGLSKALRREGYSVDAVDSVGSACDALDTKGYSAIVLDLGLPDFDGSEVVRHLATHNLDTPVLVLSARDGLDERVRLLDIGADDYLVKPAAISEFLARVRAVLRRRRSGASVVLGRVRLDLEGNRAFVDDRPLDLKAREWALLSFLVQAQGRVVSKEDIVGALQGIEGDFSLNTIDQIVSRFRRCLADTGLNLHTVRGLGYYLEVEDGGPGT